MQDQIKAWATKFGVQPAQVEAGVGAVLGLIQAKVPAPLFQQLQGLVPMAQQWIQKAQAMPAAGAQGGKDLMGMASGMLGKLGGFSGSAAALSQIISQLQNSGFNAEKAAQFVPTVLNHLQTTAGKEVFDKVMAQVPQLKDAMNQGGLAGVAGSLLGKFGKS